MATKLRIYLDTSVFSAYFDERLAERMEETRAFWTRIKEFDASTSELARDELNQTPDARRRKELISLLGQTSVHAITDEMRELADAYLSEEVFASKDYNDALHVAVAVLTRQDLLLSWNFKHLVNRRRRARVNDINVVRGAPTIEIIAPPEV